MIQIICEQLDIACNMSKQMNLTCLVTISIFKQPVD